MNFTIHRGTKEIGGSCMEVWTESTRILIDMGMPLVEKDGKEFDFSKYKNFNISELIKEGVLPDVKGLYDDSDRLIDGVVISHAHLDHYGLINYINKKIEFHLGEATHKIIELNNLFTSQEIILDHFAWFQRELAFKIGDITITPYWADHSAFDSYSFLIEANGKRIFYSGDFRSHGRKARVFQWFLHNAPQNIDYLILEGTTIGRAAKPPKTEEALELEFVAKFREPDKINLVYASGQNIDRIVSIYKACEKAGKTFVVDVYVAKVLQELSRFAKIPRPSKSFGNIKVIFTKHTGDKLKREGNKYIIDCFRDYEITEDEINNEPGKYVMLVRPSMQYDLERIQNIDGGNLTYSMWEGYLKKTYTKSFIDYLTDRKFTMSIIHTSGHADTETLIKMVDAISPKNIVPIHTFNASEYKKIFPYTVKELKDGEIKQL